jgi:hypothetical protein
MPRWKLKNDSTLPFLEGQAQRERARLLGSFTAGDDAKAADEGFADHGLELP